MGPIARTVKYVIDRATAAGARVDLAQQERLVVRWAGSELALAAGHPGRGAFDPYSFVEVVGSRAAAAETRDQARAAYRAGLPSGDR